MLKIASKEAFPVLDHEIIQGLFLLEEDFFKIFLSLDSLDSTVLNSIFLDVKGDHTPLFFVSGAGEVAGLVSAFPESEMQQRRLQTTINLMRHFGASPEVKIRFREFRRELPEVRPHSFYLSKILIKPSYRSLGAGAMAMSTLCQQATLRGFTHITLHVAVDNKKAMEFYVKQGFSISGQNSSFYSMERKL